MNTEEEEINQSIQLTPIITTLLTNVSSTLVQVTTQQEERLEYADPPREEGPMNTLSQVRASIR